MKKVLLALSASAAVILSSAANAAVYELSSIKYTNSFISGGAWQELGGAFPGTINAIATANTNAGAVTVSNLSWTAGPSNGVEYTAVWDFTTYVGDNQTITKDKNICDAVAGNFCENGTKSGFGGVELYSGGATAKVTVTEFDGLLSIIIRRGLTNDVGGFMGSATQTYRFDFTEVNEVPVPAAAWLMGSGLVGLMGMARRRKQAN